MKLFRVFADLIALLPSEIRLSFSIAIFFSITCALLEFLTIATLFPFLAELTTVSKETSLLSRVFFATVGQYIPLPKAYIVGVVFCLLVLASAMFRLFTSWFIFRLSARLGNGVGTLSLNYYLHLSYEKYTSINSSDVINNILLQSDRVVAFTRSTLNLITGSLIAFALTLSILTVNFWAASIALPTFVVLYLLWARFSRSRLIANGKYVYEASGRQIKSLQESIGGFREVLLQGTQPYYRDLFQKADLYKRYKQSNSDFISIFPRYSMEAIGIVLLIVSVFISSTAGSAIALSTLGSYALASQKLLPSLQLVYASWAECQMMLESVHQAITSSRPVTSTDNQYPHMCTSTKVSSITLDHISYSYPLAKHKVLENFSFDIRPGDIIGIKGKSGSGKSTLVDIILGLLPPTSGSLTLTCQANNGSLQLSPYSIVRSVCALVPQCIYLIDASIEENISFPSASKAINYERLICVLKQANLWSFIDSLPQGLQTRVGEKGIQLSGGQRQRIGIARALYQDATQILVLDEATSALDTDTEEYIINSIHNLPSKPIIIMIAHRLSTLKSCNKIIDLSP